MLNIKMQLWDIGSAFFSQHQPMSLVRSDFDSKKKDDRKIWELDLTAICGNRECVPIIGTGCILYLY